MMSFMRLTLFLLISILQYVLGVELKELEIIGIEPNGGPLSGHTRVTVRLKEFDKDLIDDYDRPKVRL